MGKTNVVEQLVIDGQSQTPAILLVISEGRRHDFDGVAA
jgi:hypothetical protein